jgi:hypothetical protein
MVRVRLDRDELTFRELVRETERKEPGVCPKVHPCLPRFGTTVTKKVFEPRPIAAPAIIDGFPVTDLLGNEIRYVLINGVFRGVRVQRLEFSFYVVHN